MNTEHNHDDQPSGFEALRAASENPPPIENLIDEADGEYGTPAQESLHQDPSLHQLYDEGDEEFGGRQPEEPADQPRSLDDGEDGDKNLAGDQFEQDNVQHPNNSDDPDDQPFLEMVATIRSGFERSNRAAYETLAEIHASGSHFSTNGKARNVLLKAIDEKWGEAISYTGALEQKSGNDLFLTLLFGTADKRSQKSQWAAALKAAASRGISRTKDAFVKWIEREGGIDGVIKARASKKNSEVTIDRFEPTFATSGKIAELPVPHLKPKEIGKRAILVVDLPDNYDGTQPVGGEIVSIEVEKEEVEKAIRLLHGAMKRSYARQLSDYGKVYSEDRSAVGDVTRKDFITDLVVKTGNRSFFNYWADVSSNQKKKAEANKFKPKRIPGTMSYRKIDYEDRGRNLKFTNIDIADLKRHLKAQK